MHEKKSAIPLLLHICVYLRKTLFVALYYQGWIRSGLNMFYDFEQRSIRIQTVPS